MRMFLAKVSMASLCLTNLVAFCDGVTEMVDEGRAAANTHLDLCKALDIAWHDVLASKLEIHGCDRLSIQWIRNL